MDLRRGMRDKLDKYLNTGEKIEAVMTVGGSDVYDFCCFGVDGDDKLSDDRYMVFYNQTSSPNGEITYTADNSRASFGIYLDRLPQTVRKLVFTVSIDGSGVMGQIANHTFSVMQNGVNVLSLALSGTDFKQEKAIITVEIYYKDSWRINAVARGFDGGLPDLLRAYGGEETSDTPAPAPTPAPPPRPVPPPAKPIIAPVFEPTPAPKAPKPDYGMDDLFGSMPKPNAAPAEPLPPVSSGKISLEKKIEMQAPQLVSLVKPLKVELDKRKLNTVRARVALVMDMSGSMMRQYEGGVVQEIINKILPIAVQFDDDGELDFWYFGTEPRSMPCINLQNYKKAVPDDWKRLMFDLGYGNNEAKVMKLVMERYAFTKLPVYVIFISDGEVGNSSELKQLIRDVSEKPIFWQFVGVSGKDYGVLKKLDTLKGRYVDNANFFALDDFRAVTSAELYSRLLNEFPQWLQEIKNKNMI